jgi:hypothetical protein
MNDELIDVESLQGFLINTVPSFREECLANQSINNEGNFYLLLAGFRDHIARLFREEPRSEQFSQAISAVCTLIERGNDSVRDATVISIIDVIIRDDALRKTASNFGLAALSRVIDQQVATWAEFRRKHPELIRRKDE